MMANEGGNLLDVFGRDPDAAACGSRQTLAGHAVVLTRALADVVQQRRKVERVKASLP
jgi:hypothetical protein